MNKINNIHFSYFTWAAAFQRRCNIPGSFYGRLWDKLLNKTFFFFKVHAEIYPTYMFWSFHQFFVLNFPGVTDLSANGGYSLEYFLSQCLLTVFQVWYYVPEIFSDLYTHYPKYNIDFSEEELFYIDFWVETLPIFENIFSHLVINDTPFLKDFIVERFSVFVLLNYPTINIKTPLKELTTNVSIFLEDYYFGENSIPAFKDLINFYLENRPILKDKLIDSWNQSRILNPKITNELSKYFICHYLIKDLPDVTLRFIMANLNSLEKRPLSNFKNICRLQWDSYSLEHQIFLQESLKKSLDEHVLYYTGLRQKV